MNTDTKVILGATLASLLIILGAVFFLGNNQGPKRANLGTASMSLDKTTADLGEMKVDEERAATFTITNTSNSALRLWNVATSCDCTFATVTIGNQETAEFNMAMHMSSSLKNWIGEVPAGEKALLKVIYRPKVMPVTGPVTRQVSFSTNDPKNSEIEVTVKASVL
ncbi:MAG: DUF1573 domain-containing protein [Patescibacteria group bacterium]